MTDNNGKKKIIYDLVHGYIDIDKDVETIIDTPSFQRLKHINQLTAQHLFPSANHTRFEHSLGVMKLAIDAYTQIKSDLEKLYEEYPNNFLTPSQFHEWKSKKTTDSYVADTYWRAIRHEHLEFLFLHLKYASLLHDVGHAPLSHVGEYLFEKEGIIGNISYDKQDSPLAKDAAPHELMSCYVIQKNFKTLLKEIFERKHISFDLDFIFRIITGAHYNKKLSYWDRNLLISLVNGKSFDVDKMDYLMRDNHMTGNVGGYIDSQRLFNSLTIANIQQLSFKISALSSLKKLIDCRDSLYMWVYNHHIVVYTDNLYSKCLSHFFTLQEDSESPSCHKEAISKDELFSCVAIAEKNVSDNDIYSHINKVINMMNHNELSNPKTKELISQLSGRKFLAASWKTLFEYKKFLADFPSFIRKDIPTYFENDDNIKRFQKYIKDKMKLEEYEWALVRRPNKFYNNLIRDIYIYQKSDNKDEFNELNKFLPVRDYSEIYENVAFYIFADKSQTEEIKKCFTNYFNQNIYLGEDYERIGDE